jgi:glycosyltransferase involved in cell wall biosynthesis
MGSNVIRFGEQSIVRNADAIIVVSRDLRHYFKQQYGRDVAYIPNGVEGPVSSKLDGSYLHKQLGVTPGQYLIYLGRLVPEKRIADLLLAYRQINTPYKLVITGESGYTDQYASYLRTLAEQDNRILFTGLQKRDVVHALLANASAYLSASEIEGLPMSLLECMWHGTPAIVSEIPPHKELLGNIPGYDLLFDVGQTEQITARLTRFLSSQSHYRAIAGLARERILRDYSWRSIARQTEELLLRTVQSAASRTGNRSRAAKQVLANSALPGLRDLGNTAPSEPYAD